MMMTLLSEVLRPGLFRVLHMEGEGAEVTRLKRLGVCENQILEIINTGNPLIVCVAGTRLGISRSLTHCISVQPQSSEASATAVIPAEETK
jgi:Fe2+ transport system protein FeoA